MAGTWIELHVSLHYPAPGSNEKLIGFLRKVEVEIKPGGQLQVAID